MAMIILQILMLNTLLCPVETEMCEADMESLTTELLENTRENAEEEERKWFVLVGVVSAFPKLKSERILKDYFDPAMSFLAPRHRGTRTFSDFKDKGLLMPPQIAVGRIISDKFAFSIHGGYSEGVRRTKRKDPSIFFGVPLSTRVSIRRYSTYLGMDLDYYPAGMAKIQRYESWGERLKGLKPTLGVRLNYNRTGYDARARVALGWLNRGVAVHLKNRWALPGITMVAGVDIPINERSVFVFNFGYTWFKKQTRDFDGPAVTLAWRFYF